MLKKGILCLCIAVFSLAGFAQCPDVINGINIKDLEAKMQNEGLTGWMHASVPQFHLFLFTYRDDANFFKYVDLSMFTKDSNVASELSQLRRHDKVQIKGNFIKNDSCLPHLEITSVSVLEKFTPAPTLPPYKHYTNIDTLESKVNFIGKVHAVSPDGRVLVAEYGDVVLPVFIPEEGATLVQDLYRGDIVKISYFVRLEPNHPMHLELDMSVSDPIEVYDSMLEDHGKDVTLIGQLVKFPKSPQINFDIYALQVSYRGGILRNYTIVNFDDFDLFMEALDKLKNIWDSNDSTKEVGRNYWVNPAIMLKIKGKANIVSPAQANPQIIIDNLDAIEEL